KGGHGVGEGGLRILLGCAASLIRGGVVHGIFVLVPGEFQGLSSFLGFGRERNGAKKLLRNRGDGRSVGSRAVRGGRNTGSRRLRPSADGAKRRKDQQKKARGETSHLRRLLEITQGKGTNAPPNLRASGECRYCPKGQLCGRGKGNRPH